MASKSEQGKKSPLFRKVNSKARNARHGNGGEARWNRNVKGTAENPSHFLKVKSNHRHGLDYSPLFKFLISRVGKPWASTHSDATSRLDKEEPIFWLVAKSKAEARELVRIGDSSYYGGLFVDEDGILQQVDPDVTASDFLPGCPCCTHSYNGTRLTRKFDAELSPPGGIRKLKDCHPE